jgi:hypothetical protein
VRSDNPIDEFIRLVQLSPRPRPRNDNRTRLKYGDRDPLARPNRRTVSLPRTEPRAPANAPTNRRTLIIVILRIHALVNSCLQRARKVVDSTQDLMEFGALRKCTHLIVAVQELHIERLKSQRCRTDGRRKGIEDPEKPGNNIPRKLLVRHSRHLEPPVREEFHIDLLEITGILPNLSDYNGALIEEGLVTHSALREQVARRESNHLGLIFHLEKSLRRAANRNQNVLELAIKRAKLDGATQMPRGDQCGDSERRKCERRTKFGHFVFIQYERTPPIFV